MAFEALLARYMNDDGRDVEIVAVSWGPWDGPAGQWEHGGILADLLEPPRPGPAPQRIQRRDHTPGRPRAGRRVAAAFSA
jgi:hypothetical protein